MFIKWCVCVWGGIVWCVGVRSNGWDTQKCFIRLSSKTNICGFQVFEQTIINYCRINVFAPVCLLAKYLLVIKFGSLIESGYHKQLTLKTPPALIQLTYFELKFSEDLPVFNISVLFNELWTVTFILISYADILSCSSYKLFHVLFLQKKIITSFFPLSLVWEFLQFVLVRSCCQNFFLLVAAGVWLVRHLKCGFKGCWCGS